MAATRPLQSRADCEANFDLIRFWISQCELHPVCARVPDFASKFQLPTRLIDIGLNSDASPRLILSSDLNESADCRYVTLSHCWGDPSKVPKTVRMTLTQHQKRITGLSKTFEDAIEVTRQIGVRYLWIDSFCIIQQDITDWEIECSRMSLTYARAYCVLSAMDVVEGSDGLFIPRSSLSPPTHIDNVTSWDSASKGPLSTRGWAFQEHQLSTRIIHFTKSRILWECRACVAYEESSVPVPRVLLGSERLDHSVPSGQWRLFDGRLDKYVNVRRFEDFPESEALQVQHDIQTRWLRAVEVYSSRSLTFSDDRLPALSGLASAVSSIMVGNDYLAGIWRDDITRGLLWQRSQALAPITNKLASVPSWSWASYPGQVRFLLVLGAVLSPKDCDDFVIPAIPLPTTTADMKSHWIYRTLERTKCWTTLSSLDLFGQVDGGFLQIDTEVRIFKIAASSPGLKWSILGEEVGNVTISMDNPDTANALQVTFAMLVGEEYGEGGCYGLILQEIRLGIFERAGVFWLRNFRGRPKFEDARLTIV